MGVDVAFGPDVFSKGSHRTKMVFALETDWGYQHCSGLARTPRVFDPDVLTWKRSRTSVSGGMEMGEVLQVKSQSCLTKREIKEWPSMWPGGPGLLNRKAQLDLAPR